jgi:hypothetical protein
MSYLLVKQTSLKAITLYTKSACPYKDNGLNDVNVL